MAAYVVTVVAVRLGASQASTFVRAESEEAARREGAERLGVSPSQVTATLFTGYPDR